MRGKPNKTHIVFGTGLQLPPSKLVTKSSSNAPTDTIKTNTAISSDHTIFIFDSNREPLHALTVVAFQQGATMCTLEFLEVKDGTSMILVQSAKLPIRPAIPQRINHVRTSVMLGLACNGIQTDAIP
jgi:hypothetical protein